MPPQGAAVAEAAVEEFGIAVATVSGEVGLQDDGVDGGAGERLVGGVVAGDLDQAGLAVALLLEVAELVALP